MARRITALQGEIWNVDFDPIIGHEQGGYRPALILSQGAFNTSAVELVVVAAITSRRRGLGSEVPIEAPEGGLDQDSVILAHQLRTVSHERLDRRRGQVRPETLDAVLAISQRLISRPARPIQ